ncbi:MAG: hypothetical protein ACRC8S_00535 [Fimbriiglobus sp.]
MILSIYYDPIPTPAGRSGRASMTTGMIGWAIMLVASIFWVVSMQLEAESPNLAKSASVTSGWIAGGCVICYFIGILLAASGITKLMNGIPDPGMKSIVLGFVFNGLPMVLVALAAAYDKYGKSFTE